MKSSSINTKKRGERLAVIDNIAAAVRDGDSFRKVETGDPVVTPEDIRRTIVPFDNMRRRPLNRIKAAAARAIAKRATEALNTRTEIVGLENALSVEGGAIITCNHFNPMDSTVIRYMAMKCGRASELSIVVQESNIFMKGFFGFLMRNCNTMPVSSSASYMAKNLKPALKERLGRGELILIYPEQEMWFNYRKPRELRVGAYHYAAELSVPILPCFVEMRECEQTDETGFYTVKHILHVMPPIYPDPSLTLRENRDRLLMLDSEAKRSCYESSYGIALDSVFVPERDIAGFRNI